MPKTRDWLVCVGIYTDKQDKKGIIHTIIGVGYGTKAKEDTGFSIFVSRNIGTRIICS
jgi:hypothetical protein